MEKWILKQNTENKINYVQLGLSEYIYQILLNRNIDTKEKIEKFLKSKIEDMNTPLLLPDIIKASNLIINKINRKEKIRIIGDYDVDGVMSTYILYKGLTILGGIVDYKIPSRAEDGYGINNSMIEDAVIDGIGLIITCDNGIAAINEIEYAKSKEIDIIITDHHEPPIVDGKEVLPDCPYIVDPKRSTSKYPFVDICGAVVAFKLIEYLFKINSIEESRLHNEFLEFAAIATICDVMPLIDENRIVVHYGLRNLNKTSNIGLRALMEASDILGKEIQVYHVGFIIGPTINSSGRLKTADFSLKLLLEENYNNALKIAKSLRELNSKRQKLTDEGFISVDNKIKQYKMEKKFPVFVLRDKEIDESIVGIVAGRIKEKYNHPTIVLTESKGLLKGSGRSIEEYNMFEKISELKHLLDRFGGHAMACGLSLKEENYKDFVININNDSKLKRRDLIKKVYIDLNLKLLEIDNYLLMDIDKLKPFGNGNPKPVFATKNLKIMDFKVFGKENNVLKMVLNDGTAKLPAVLFEKIETFYDNISIFLEKKRLDDLINYGNADFNLDIVYTPVINEYKGNKNIQLNIANYRISGVNCDRRIN
ncbi:single-stranded-DNA-specific exonuclease RecJ [Peptoniphilus sp. ING2-D1G]|nr:single-stranded-DNA-specific exonuclease RecJ [Peptoniphilus sp. ING2-D1G]